MPEGFITQGAALNALGGTHVEPISAPQDANVATPYGDYDRLMKLWHLPRVLMRGTRGMREAGLKYLPKEPAESGAAYDSRLNRSYLFNAFRKTVKDMTGKVFQREVTLEEDVPKQIKDWSENIDLAGRHLNVFARDVFFDGMQTGINYILVEMPPALPVGSTLADEQAAGNRPYLVHIKAEDLIGFKSETIAGVVTLSQVRIRETETIENGQFSETSIEQIRVLEPGTWQKWRRVIKDGKPTDEWAIFEEGTTSLDEIPLIPVYIHRTGFMKGEPPLEDLADLNVAHWQSQSDQRTILHVARVPILFFAGGGDDAVAAIGPNSMFRSKNVAARLEYVEHSGAAITAGAEDIKTLEFQMQVQGLQLLVPNPGQTATGEIRDDAKENSPLAMMAMALGDALESALGLMAEYVGLDQGGSVDVNTDFGVGTGTGIDLANLTNGATAGGISWQTWREEMKRRDILADSFDEETEQERLQGEMPTLDSKNPMNLDGSGRKPPSGSKGKAVDTPGGKNPSDVVAGFPPASEPGIGAGAR